MSEVMYTPEERALKLELYNKAIKRAGWYGWSYGMGIAVLVEIAFIHWWGSSSWTWLIPAFISGATFGPLVSTVFRWMAVMEQKQ